MEIWDTGLPEQVAALGPTAALGKPTVPAALPTTGPRPRAACCRLLDLKESPC